MIARTQNTHTFDNQPHFQQHGEVPLRPLINFHGAMVEGRRSVLQNASLKAIDSPCVADDPYRRVLLQYRATNGRHFQLQDVSSLIIAVRCKFIFL